MTVRKFEMPWRPAYETWAAGAWVIGVYYFVYLAGRALLPMQLAMALAAFSAVLAVIRGRQALRILILRASLSGRAMEVISTKRLAQLTQDPGQVFMGYGFEVQPQHSQRLHDLLKVNYKDFAASPHLLRFLGYPVRPQPEEEIGVPYIHGVEPVEVPLYRPLQNFEGGTLLVGTTQAGKGVGLGNFLTQAIRRGDMVVVIDPKNSARMKKLAQRACRDFRDPDTFLEFHPAFPDRGVRLDFTYTWQKATELASRIQSIMPVDASGTFTAFGWDAVNVVAQALVNLEDRPNLVKLKKYIEGGIDKILEASLVKFFEQHLGHSWRDTQELRTVVGKVSKGILKSPSPVASTEMVAYVIYYEQHIPDPAKDQVIDSLIRVFRHNRDHYTKITSNLLPILSMLTSGDLGRSLSPDPWDLNDLRPIMNFEKIENGGHVLYLCLDSLPDPSVASAIAGLAIADLASRAGIRYNLGSKRRITLIADELSNVINQPLIEILNKGAEGGVTSICAMQTLADLAKRLGSEDAARMALGNLNNLYALRSKDRPTQDFIVETFGKTGIHSMKTGINHGADTHVGDWSTGHSAQLSETMEERVPADVLGRLPNCQYFGMVGGRLIKGRFQILDPDWDAERLAA